MNRSAFLFFETGLSSSIPGVADATPWCLFPAWGNYFFLDLLLSSLGNDAQNRFDLHFFFKDEFHESLLAGLSFWGRETTTSLLPIPEASGDAARWVRTNKYEKFVLARSSFAAFFESQALFKLVSLKTQGIIRLSIGNRPLDCYIVPRKKLLSLLERIPATEPGKGDWTDRLFKKELAADAESVTDVPGILVFSTKPLELYKEHTRFLSMMQSAEYGSILNRFAPRRRPQQEAYVGEGGEVSGSFIGAGAEIHGKVKNSVIFQDVFVGRACEISGSVVMNGNRIAPAARITNSLIFPYLKRRLHETCNIEARATIGGTAKNLKNRTYPRLIYDGVAVVGMNAEIPEDARIEEASFIAPDLPKTKLTHYNKVERCASILE